MKAKLLALLLPALAWYQPAAAQRCAPRAAVSSAVFIAAQVHRARHHAGCDTAVARPFVPSRWGLFFGLAGYANRLGGFGGVELAGTYRVAERLQAELAGSVLIPGRIGPSLGTDAAKPLLGLYSVTARANMLLLDNAKLRAGVLTGLGVGTATLADRAQQVVDQRQQTTGCGCEPSTHARTLATSVGLVGLAGATTTYKLRPDMWLTAKAYYQQWAGATRFGSPEALSPWVLSLGLTMPDRWK